jgi:hypothetical protein
MKILIAILTCLFISTLGFAQSADSAENMIMYIDDRLEVLDERAAAITSENAIKPALVEKEVKPKAVVPVYSELNVGKKTVTGSISTRNGFRVQIYNGSDRNMALKIKGEFSKRFPSYRSYLSYNVPNFKIKVGDFSDKKEAARFLKLIIPFLPSASIVPDIVTIKNIQIQ